MKMRWENTKKETESSVLKTKEFLLSFPIAKILADSNTGVYNTVCRILDTGRLNLFYFAESWSGSANSPHPSHYIITWVYILHIFPQASLFYIPGIIFPLWWNELPVTCERIRTITQVKHFMRTFLHFLPYDSKTFNIWHLYAEK